MALKKFFTGKTGAWFWTNIGLMVLVIVAVPVVTFYMLETFTHHGEKIEVPVVTGKSLFEAEGMLQERGLVAVVADSAYDRSVSPGAVLEQSPKAGYEVKTGRVVYLTVNMRQEPKAELPDVVGHGSLREAVALLGSLGFKLTPNETVMGSPKDLVLGVKQGTREVHAGEMISRDRALTLVVGGGDIDTMRVDSLVDVDDIDIEW